MKKILLIPFVALILIFNSNKTTYAFSSSAESHVVIEINSGRVISSKNENSRMLTASIAKIMTAIVAIENGDLEEYVKVDKETVLQEGSKLYLEIDDEIKLKDLLYGLMLRSGNDAAYLIAKHISGSVEEFAILMNEMAKKINMENSTFENPSGLDDDVQSFNYSTALDMGLLTSYAYKNDVYKEISGTEEITITTKNNKKYLFTHKHRLIGVDNINGGKTGYTKKANRTLVSTASKDGLDFVVVTFNDGNDFADHKTMFNQAFDKYKMFTIINKQEFNYDAYINYRIKLDEDIKYPLLDDELDKLRGNISFTDSYALIEIYLNNEILLEKKIYKDIGG